MNEESLFHRALELPANQRAEFLDRACPSDALLRQRLEILLSAHENPGSFLRESAAALNPTADANTFTEHIGTLVGPYKLLQKLGEGGMGVVYMAEQQEPVRRKVALKIIKPGMDSREVIARFEAERQALAMMDHVNIAKVLEAGTTDTGQPYFVMELVHGVAITKYCDDNQLTPRQRLELFIPVCRAIQHAHQKGIIHRDIKPSNVMVTMYDDKPVPKIIDFGVAKAVEQRLTEKSLFTQYGALVGTFEYMSPEQAEMNAFGVDTRSDIYSLGVLLYELLTGTTPLEHKRLREAGYGEIVRLIKEEEPVRPSMRLSTSGAALAGISRERGTEPTKLQRVIRGDLDWIVLRCLEKDRAQRYETATGLAQDIQRYLTEEPVSACPPSAWYRFRKMARRNKAAMTTMALVAATLVLGIVLSAWQAVRAMNAENAALTAEANAKVSEHSARESEKNAIASAAIAIKQEQVAREQAKIAEGERRKAEVNESKAEWRLYSSNIASAQREWETGNIPLLYHFLDQCRLDFRGWEHDYLFTQANQDLMTLRGHKEGVCSIAFSPDGKRLASRTRSHRTNLWDANNGKELLDLPIKGVFSSKDATSDVAFSSDGQFLATFNQSTLTLINAVNGDKLMTFGPPIRENSAGHYSLIFSPDGKRLACTTLDKAVKLWDVTTGAEVLTMRGHTLGVRSVAFSPDGKRLASASEDQTVKIWDTTTGQEVLTIKGHGNYVTCVAFSPDGKWLASASTDQTVKLWDAVSGQFVVKLNGHKAAVSCVAFSPDSNQVASGSFDKTVMLWNATTGGAVRTILGHTGVVESVAFSPDGQRLASASRDKTIKFWRTDRMSAPLAVIMSGHQITCIAFNPNGKTLAIGSKRGSSGFSALKMWDVESGQDLANFEGHAGVVYKLTFSPNGKQVASVGGNANGTSEPKVWDVASGKEIANLSGHELGSVVTVAFSPDGKRLVSAGSSDKWPWSAKTATKTKKWPAELRIWDIASGRLLANREWRNSRYVNTVAFSPDGNIFASGSSSSRSAPNQENGGVTLLRPGELKLWDTTTGQQVATLHGHTKDIMLVAFSPDGKLLVSAGTSERGPAKGPSELKLWAVNSGQELLNLNGHVGAVTQVAFSPDGNRLASASTDKTVKLWDVATGQLVLTLTGHNGDVSAVTFSADGKRLASASEDGTIIVWDASRSMKDLEEK